MRGFVTLAGGGMTLLIAGCGLWTSDPKVETEELRANATYAPPQTEDRLAPSEATSEEGAALPLAPIARGQSRQLDDRALERLRRYNRQAWLEYTRTLRDPDADDEARDRACRNALDALVRAVIKQGGTPLDEGFISLGLELTALSRTREHRFAVPSDRIREQARRKRNTPDGKLVMLYLERYDLYHTFLLDSLMGCGLDQSAVYWTPSFTLLDLELRGIEEKYLKIIESPNWKQGN